MSKTIHLHELKQFSAGIKFSHFELFDQEVWGKERIPTLRGSFRIDGSLWD